MPYTWAMDEQYAVLQGIDQTDTTQNHPIGKIVKAKDNSTANRGEGEFIYLLGVASTLPGSVVTYNATTGQTVLAPNTANQAAPVAVSMSANIAAQWGWYQIGGLTTSLKTAVAVTPQVPVFLSATAGRVKVLASAGLQILGARSANLTTVVAGTSTVVVMLDRPHLQGQIT